MSRLSTFSLIACLLLSALAHSQEGEVMTLRFAYGDAAESGEPPYYYLNKKGEMEGAVVDVLRAVFAPQRVKLLPVYGPRNRLMKLFSGRQVDIDVMNPAWVSNSVPVVFSNKVYISEQLIFSRRDRVQEFARFEDLRGKRLCTHRGYVYGTVQEMMDSGELIRADGNTDEQMLKMLLVGRCDVMVGPELTTKELLQDLGLEDRLVRTPLVDQTWDLKFMLSKEKRELLPRINAFLARENFDALFDAFLQRHKTLLAEKGGS